MTFKTTKLRDAITFALAAGATAIAGTGIAFAQEADEQQPTTTQQATTLDRIEVTGSRIKRADIEGSVPVTVIDRAQIEASGDVSVADFLRDTSFNSFGSYQTTSGSSWQGASGISLRGLGEGRTLILIDGRRAPVSPQSGSFQNLNTIPLAAVERIEILSDGASAIYGSDALAGVVNIITRKDFEGIEIAYGQGFPSQPGGDTQEGSILFGASGDRGRLLGGYSYNKRDELYSRDRDFWTAIQSGSVYSNNLLTAGVNPANTVYGYSPVAYVAHPEFGAAVPGSDCFSGTNLFWNSGSGAGTTCQYDHVQISANLTSVENQALFIRGDYQVTDDWLAYFSGTSSRTESFGRFAPVPSSPWPGTAIFLAPGTLNHPGNPDGYNAQYASEYSATDPYFLYHRFAALGPRDNRIEDNTYDYNLGFQGMIGAVDIDFGVRSVESRAINLGTNYVVGGLAQAAIDNGSYNIYDPFAADAATLRGFTSTISRDLKSKIEEVYGSVGFDLFSMGGGTAAAVIGAEYREEFYQDTYDPLSEGGQIVGSAGNSARGTRDIYAGYFEVLFPFFDGFEMNIAGRYDQYSDYGSDFAPKVSFRWQVLDTLTLRAAYGEGFRAPPLSSLTRAPSFSAAAVTHNPTCVLQGLQPGCGSRQVNTYGISNPFLESESSEQWGLGAVWDATDWLSLTVDYYNIKIDNSLASITIQGVLNCLEGSGTLCPSGLSWFPANTVLPNPALGLGILLDPNTGGILLGQTGTTNIGTIETQGFDFSFRTNFDLGDWGRLRNSLQGGHVTEYSVNSAQSIAGRPGYPRWRAQLGNAWEMQDWSFAWNMNYIHSTQSQSYRDWLALVRTNNRTAAQESNLALFASRPKNLPSWLTHDVQLSYRAPWNATITLGVRNLTDKEAVLDPYYNAGNGDFDSYLYDTWGRIPYFRYSQRF